MPEESYQSYVQYSIQNVDFSTHLELYDIGDPSKVVLRPLNPDPLQQWQLIPANDGTQSFKILNVATENLTPRLCLTATASTQSNNTLNISCAPESACKNWTTQLFTINGSSVYSITCPISQGSVGFLAVDEKGKLKCVQDAIATPNQVGVQDTLPTQANPKRDRQWRILEVSAPLVSGTYTLRNLNGNTLHMKPGGQVTTERVNRGAHEKWDVACYGNGKCTIKNVKEDLYLGWEEKTSQIVLKADKSTEQKVWNVRDVGDYSFIITMDYVKSNQTTLQLLLSWKDDNQAILKSSKIAHNRVWVFERTTVTSADTAKPPPPIIFVPARYKEINSGARYHFKNVATSRFLGSSSPGNPVPVARSGVPWYICYTGMTGEFHLALDPGRQSCAKFLASNANLYTFESRQTLQDTWMLDRVDDAEGIFYHIFPTNRTNSALVHASVDDATFTLAPRQPGNRNQLWKLI